MAQHETHTFFAVSPPGLEALVADELEANGFGRGRVLPGGVEWQGPLGEVLGANLRLRLPNRILVRFARFQAATFPDLFRQAARLPWADWLPADARVRFRVTSHRSRLYHTGGIAERLADGLARRLPGARIDLAAARDDRDDPPVSEGASAGVADEPPQLVVARLDHDEVELSLDASGGLLSRRGYRLATAKAPLRENLAAALLWAAGWRGQGVLVDPFCGSGTVAIEAAELALGLQPGRNRAFACERWPAMASAGPRTEPSEPAGAPAFRVLASDRAEGALKALQGNAGRAGVATVIEASRADFLRLDPPAATGWLVSNPPYGVRTHGGAPGAGPEALAARLRSAWSGWRVALLVPTDAAAWARAVSPEGPGARPVRTRNGGLDVVLRVGVVAPPGPPRRKRSP